MGLLLSVFVIFVSVVELLAFYSNFRARLQPVSSDRDFSPLIRRYEAGLHKERQRILKILDEYRKFDKSKEGDGGGRAPNNSQSADAHQSSTTAGGEGEATTVTYLSDWDLNKKDSKLISRSPSPLIPAVPRNSICSGDDDFYQTKFHEELVRIHRNVSENAIGERKICYIDGTEEDGILHTIAPSTTSTGLDENAFQVAGRAEIVVRPKREQFEIKELSYKKEPLVVRSLSDNIAQHGCLGTIANDAVTEDNCKKETFVYNAPFDARTDLEKLSFTKQPLIVYSLPEIIFERPDLEKIINGTEKSCLFHQEQDTDKNTQNDYEINTGEVQHSVSNENCSSLEFHRKAENFEKGEITQKELLSNKTDKPSSSEESIENEEIDKFPEKEDFINHDLHSITFDSVDYWPSKVSIEKKKGKLKDKTNKKRVKFGLDVEEIEPEWSRAPSPIFKLISEPTTAANAVDIYFLPIELEEHEEPRKYNFESLRITDLSQQLVTEDYWRRSPSPFRDFLDSNKRTPEEKSWDNNKQIISEDEDEVNEIPSEELKKPEKPKFSFQDYAWDPNKKIVSSDEETEIPLAYDEDFINALDGIKLNKSDEKKKSRNHLKKHKQKSTSSASSSKQCSLESPSLSESETIENTTVINHTNKSSCNNHSSSSADGGNKLSEDIKRIQKPSDNSATNAFWLIFSGEYTKAMNKDWHGQHFCCWQCDESLTGQRYVLREEHPYCVACYESVFANSCEKCSRTIGIDSKDLSYKDKHWHEACFLCATCGDSLVDKQFGSKGDRIYCGRCYDEQFASRCDGCGQIFRAGTKKMEYKTRQWHEKCFCCCVCKTPIGTQSFIPREQEIYCAKCYEEKYATRCIKCNKVITSGGVTYKNEPWHRECFTCTHCNTSLAGARFTSRDDKPYCAECFGELFAKRCTACNKPITGIGGTKFISFEDRHWHNDCFFCASCRTSLVGRGFITDGDDIICPECAKQKLM